MAARPSTSLPFAIIKEDRIEVIPDEFEAVEHGLRLAIPDDLLVIFGDEITRCWKQIINFNPQEKGASQKASAVKKPDTDFPQNDDFVLDQSQRLIRDERGVRLAKEEAD